MKFVHSIDGVNYSLNFVRQYISIVNKQYKTKQINQLGPERVVC